MSDDVRVWLGRGPSIPRSGGGLSDLVATFVHGIATALGWRAGSAIATALGPTALITLAIVGVAIYLLSRRKTRR